MSNHRCIWLVVHLFISVILVQPLSAAPGFAENLIVADIKGTVLDETGAPLPGATITIQGTTKGTVSDIDGNFSIDMPENGTLMISFIGYKTQVIAIGNESIISVQMIRNSA